MTTPVLGLNFGTHDSAAALVIDGRVVAAAEEERFSRVKHTKAFPASAIAYCLAEAGLSASDRLHVALFVDPRLQWRLAAANTCHTFPRSIGSLASDLRKALVREALPGRVQAHGLLAGGGDLFVVRHHLAHAASAYLASPFDDACVVTIDGRGEYETACVFAGRGGQLIRRHNVLYPHSVGYLYSMITRYLGFRPQRDEYKVMGLAGFGTPAAVDRVNRLATVGRGGKIRLNLGYFDHHRRASHTRQHYSAALIELLGPPRGPDEPIEQHHRDIAYGAQRLTERLILAYVEHARRLVPSKNLCLAGGVALNGVANAAIVQSGWFNQIYVQPAANDAGSSLGAAFHVARRQGSQRHPMGDAFLGPAYSAREIRDAVVAATRAGHGAEEVDEPACSAAMLLADGKIIGWYAGRMEFGPRALGARSVLAAATDSATVSRINAMIKRREMFRPLAPAAQIEHADAYFHLHDAGRLMYPFMVATTQVRPTAQASIPAVVHVDGTARVQTVSRLDNPILWHVIEEYRRITGIPVLLNTSFNTADEPIVCTPADAVATYLRSGLDALIIGNHLVRRPSSESR